MAGPIKISVVADARDLVKEMPKAEAAINDVADTAKSAGSKIDTAFASVGESADGLASTSSQVAGGLGDLGGALGMLPGPLGAAGSSMEMLAPAIMGVTGASDLLNAATTKFPGLAKVASGAARGMGVAMQFATGPIGLIIIGIAALVAGLVVAYKKSETFRDIVNSVFGFIKNLFLNFTPFGIVISRFDELVGFVRKMPGRIASAASGMWDGIKDAFRASINWLIGKWNGLSFTLPGVDVPGIGKIGGFTLSTPNIPMLANGGIVTGPTFALIGEAGPEAVIPLDRLGTGAQVIELHLSADVLDEVSRGRRYIAAIDAANGAGVRRLAIGGAS